MNQLVGKNILLVIPKSQFCEQELSSIQKPLIETGANVLVMSKTGQETQGMNKTKFKPDGILADWDKQPGVHGKYDAILVLGGKGSRKSLWDDPLLPQILTDHYRAGKFIGAIGTSVVVLARGGFIQGSCPAPDDETTRREVEACGLIVTNEPFSFSSNVLATRDAEASLIITKILINQIQ